MVTPSEFSHVGLRSDSVDETVRFLEEFLDAEVLDTGEIVREEWDADVDYAALALADKTAFVVDPTPYEAAGLVDPLSPGVAHYGFVVDDASAAVAEWRADGGEVLMEPFTLGDARYAFCHGPEGTRIELVEHLDE